MGSRQHPPGIEALVRSRRARIVLAAGLAATGGWAFAPYALSEVGGTAWVNAPLTRIASPIAGTVGAGVPEAGSFIARRRRVRLVTARGLDGDALAALLGQQAALVAARDLADRQRGEVSIADAALASHAAAYARAATGQAAAAAVAAQADAAACRAEASASALNSQRMTALAARGFAANAAVERATAAAAAGAARCAALAARALAAAGEARAARAGVYIATGGQDTPYALQQRDRLALRAQELATIAVDTRARLAELGPRIAAARAQLARAAAYDLDLGPSSIVWAVAVAPGSSVAAGAALLDLADCTRRFVEVTLPERRMEVVYPGQPVQVRLIGGDEWATGRVVRTAGAAARRDTAMVAAGDADRDPRALTVEIALPPALPAAAGRRCDIGRLAEVRFARWAG